MSLMGDDVLIIEPIETPSSCDERARPRRHGPCAPPLGLGRFVAVSHRAVASASDWVFGAVALTLGLSVLAATPVAQFLSFGYLLEAGGRVARSGRLRDGFVGIRKASRLGSIVVGVYLFGPAATVSSLAERAACRSRRTRRPWLEGVPGRGDWPGRPRT